MRPTLTQCFPNPLARQWPSTSNPVSCECQQLYALVCLCCCIPKTHLLVLHEGAGNNMVNSMPKGPKYVEYRITHRTTAEDIGSFLYRAELASASSAAVGQGLPPHHSRHRAVDDDDPPLGNSGLLFSPSSPANSSAATGPGCTPPTAASAATGGGPNSASMSGGSTGPVMVVCLHGIAVATPDVRSVLMDVMVNAQVPYSRAAKAVPSLRIVAFCNYRACVGILPEPLRAAFALSTFISGLSMDSAVVLQCADVRASNIVNKAYMLEVLNSPDGLSLVDTVLLSGEVARYLRHLILTVRASTMAELAPGTMIIQRMSYYTRLLKMAALLFMPSESVFVRRANPRSGAFKSASDYYAYVSRGNSAEAAARVYGGARYGAERQGEGYAANGGSDIFAAHKDRSGRITTFSHVVVSPSDVICLVPAIVTHHLTLHRAVVDVGSRMAATRDAMAAVGAPLLSEISSRNELSASPLASRGGAANLFFSNGTAGCAAPRLWDARMASLALARRPAASTHATRVRRQVDPASDPAGSFAGNDGTTVTLASAPPTARHSISGSAARRPTLRPSPPVPSLEDTLYLGQSNVVMDGVHVDESDLPEHDFLNYCEMREVVRATLVCRSHPAPA